ncbi:MAG: tetraacyldisaccharide 4'-kinase, partial [Lentisphaeria bacterium]|nr:tetraacyldisaccharide 4'-kinase [Lentisphaeria bacterium]
LAGKRHAPMDKLVRCSLYILSRVYATLVRWRISLYKNRILKDHRLGCLVISIGNLTVGGTGKTPVVEVFARTLTKRNRKVAVLSRGYKSKSKPISEQFMDKLLMREDIVPPRVVSDGKDVLLNSHMSGDEPFMLAQNLDGVVVLVDKNRVKSGRYAIRHFNADTLILDDGFQYLHLKPRLNILLIDSTKPFTNHHMLPRGFLREPIQNLRRADIIFLTKSNGGDHLRHLKQFVKKHNPIAEIIECTHRPLYVQDIYSEKVFPLEFLNGKKVSSICGIAVPESFETFLKGFGAELVYFERYADHHRYSRAEIDSFITKSIDAGAELILTTEKDAVRFPEFKEQALPMLFMRVEIDILSGQESFQQCIDRICFPALPNQTQTSIIID